jgi:hypothetical protein
VESLLYFYHLTLGENSSLIDEILYNKIASFEYILLYIGNPFVHLLTNYAASDLTSAALRAGEILAVAFICLVTWSSFRSLASARQFTLSWALILFIVYILLTAVSTASGRLQLGQQQASSSRYVTPTLYGWTAVLLLYWPVIRQKKMYRNLFAGLLVALFYFLMLPQQVQALTNERVMVMDRELSALALELQIDDNNQISHVFPSPAFALQISAQARERHLSVFGMKPIRDAHLLLGLKINFDGFPPCAGGFLGSVTTLPDDQNYFRVSGWLFNSRYTRAPDLVYLVDESNHIIGVALTGFPGPDVAVAERKKAQYSGFQGYLSSNEGNQKISIVNPDDRCVFSPQA